MSLAVVLVGLGVAWGTLKSSVRSISKTLDEQLVPDLKNVRERFMVVEDRVKTLWKDEVAPAFSPRQLNERGEKILAESGIKKLIDIEKDKMLAEIKAKNIGNPYDAEQCVLQLVADLKKNPEKVEKLKTGAYTTGADIDTVLLVGGIYLRNLVFPDLGFALEDLDKPKTS